MKLGKKNLILGILLTAFFGITYFILIPAAVYIPKNVMEAGISPATWPKLATSIIVILGICVAIQGALQIKRDKAVDLTKLHNEKQGGTTNYLKILAVMAALLVYYYVIDILGIVLSSIIMLIGVAITSGERRPKVLLLVGILVPLGLYYFFVKVAHVPMPLGIFETLLN